MSDGDCAEEMSYDEDEEDYKYEDATEEEEMGHDNTDVLEATDDDEEVDLTEVGPRKVRKLERQVSYQVHQVNKILAKQKLVISEISDLLRIPNHDAVLLLRNYKWDKETACDAWWSEQTTLRIQIGLPPVMMQKLSSVSNKDSCILCRRKPIEPQSESSAGVGMSYQHYSKLVWIHHILDLTVKLVMNISAQKCSVTLTEQPGSASIPSQTSTGYNSVMGTRAVTRDLKILFKQKKFEVELPNEDNIFEVDLIIKCLGNWEGIVHRFRAKIPSNYPFTFPVINCLESEKSFHPNIQPSDGSVCLGILTSEEWKAMYTLTDVCTALSNMFLIPNWEHFLNQEVFELFHDNKNAFDDRLRSLGATIPMSEILEIPTKVSKNAAKNAKKELKSAAGVKSGKCTASSAVNEEEIRHTKVAANQFEGKEDNNNESALPTVCVKAMTDIRINEEEKIVEENTGHNQSKSPLSKGKDPNQKSQKKSAASMKIVQHSTEIVESVKISSCDGDSSKSDTSVTQDFAEMSTIKETIAMVRTFFRKASFLLLLLVPHVMSILFHNIALHSTLLHFSLLYFTTPYFTCHPCIASRNILHLYLNLICTYI